MGPTDVPPVRRTVSGLRLVRTCCLCPRLVSKEAPPIETILERRNGALVCPRCFMNYARRTES